MSGPLRPVTVDAGGADDLFVGALVTWMHVPRGGYGFVLAVHATVERVTKRRVTVRVMTAAGSRVKRVVAASTLRWGRA